MKKVIFVALMLLAVCSFAAYNIFDTVLPEDNLSWTVDMPDPYTGQSSNLFDTVTNGKAVLMFFGLTT